MGITVDSDSPRLILAGFGASSALQLTVEAQQMAVYAGHVLSLGVPGRLQALLERQGVAVAALDGLLERESFAEGYAAVAQAVLARAEHDPPAMFISQGSPLFMNAITRYLVAEANRRAFAVRILPGVSSIDVVVAELGIDVGKVGLQTLSAAGLVARPVALNPRMPLLLLEVAGLAAKRGSLEAYGPLYEVMVRTYPATQPVTLINMTGDGGISRATVTLDNFAEILPKIDTSSCLFVDIRKKVAPAESTTEAH